MGNCNSCSCGGCGKTTSLEQILKKYEGNETLLIPCLQEIQGAFGYISKEAIKEISRSLCVAESQIYGVISFYSQFRTNPAAKYTIDVCMGTACYVLGAGDLLEGFCEKLGIKVNEVSEDGKWMVANTRCLGCCGLAPVVTVNGKVYGKLKKEDIDKVLSEYKD